MRRTQPSSSTETIRRARRRSCGLFPRFAGALPQPPRPPGVAARSSAARRRSQSSSEPSPSSSMPAGALLVPDRPATSTRTMAASKPANAAGVTAMRGDHRSSTNGERHDEKIAAVRDVRLPSPSDDFVAARSVARELGIWFGAGSGSATGSLLGVGPPRRELTHPRCVRGLHFRDRRSGPSARCRSSRSFVAKGRAAPAQPRWRGAQEWRAPVLGVEPPERGAHLIHSAAGRIASDLGL